MTNENSKINAKGGDNLSLPIGIRQRNHLAFKDFYVSLIHYMAMVEIGAENEKYIDDKKISQAFDMLFPG